jgi:hypothetical protein
MFAAILKVEHGDRERSFQLSSFMYLRGELLSPDTYQTPKARALNEKATTRPLSAFLAIIRLAVPTAMIDLEASAAMEIKAILARGSRTEKRG